MEEIELNINSNGQFKNLYLNEKETLEVGGVKISLPNIREGRYIEVVKNFAMPKEVKGSKFQNLDGTPKISYSYGVKYKGEDVSFFINKKSEADALNVLGTVGSRIRITAELYDNKFGGKSQNLKFELVK